MRKADVVTMLSDADITSDTVSDKLEEVAGMDLLPEEGDAFVEWLIESLTDEKG